MYLVLLAMLALQVSSAIMEKFVFLDESLASANEGTHKNNEALEHNIEKAVEDGGGKDKVVLEKAQRVREEANEVFKFIDDIRKELIVKTGGKEESGMYKGASDDGFVMEYMIGPEGSKKGVGYKLKDKLKNFSSQIREITKGKGVDIKDLALDGKEDPIFKNNPEQKRKDFVELSFEHTPLVAALAVLNTKKAEVLKAENDALNILAAEVGATDLKFDKIEASYNAESKVVAAGTKYHAEVFLLASSSAVIPTVKVDGKSLEVKNGRGILEFTATGGTYDKEGIAKKNWKGMVTINNKGRDTTFEVLGEYLVAKPVIQVQSASVSALYRNCGNELNVQVPALGSTYNPSFTASGARVIPGSQKGLVTLIPDAPNVTLKVSSGGNYIGEETFKVRLIPKPDIQALVNGKPVDEKRGVPAPGPNSVVMKAVPDESFAAFLPKDARYAVTEWEAILVRGRRPVQQMTFNGAVGNFSQFKGAAKEGDRIVIDVKKVQRKNFVDKIEDVNIPTIIKNIPLN